MHGKDFVVGLRVLFCQLDASVVRLRSILVHFFGVKLALELAEPHDEVSHKLLLLLAH